MQVVAVLAVAVLAVCHAQFFSPGLYQQKQALARRFGIIEKDENKGLRLACTSQRNSITFTTAAPTLTTPDMLVDRELKVTIQMKPHDSGSSSHHHHHFGRSFALRSPFASPASALGFGGPAYAAQNVFGRPAPFAFGLQHQQNNHNKKNKLTANIEIINQGLTPRFVTGKYKIIITERGRPGIKTLDGTMLNMAAPMTFGTSCAVENFGTGLKVDDNSHDHGHLGVFAGPAFFHGHGHHFSHSRSSKEPAGVVGEVDFGDAAGTRSQTIDKLKGFHDLEDLDGRGLILCKSDMVDEDFEGKAECSMFEEALCCGLTYEKDTKSTTTTG